MRSKLKRLRSHLGTKRSRRQSAYAVEYYSFARASLRTERAVTLPALYALEEFAERHLEGGRKSCEVMKTDLARTPLKVGDVDLVDTGMLGEVDLPPTILLSELPDSFAQLDAYIRVHSSSIDLVEALYLVDALSAEIRRKSEGLRAACQPRLAPAALQGAEDRDAGAILRQKFNEIFAQSAEWPCAMCSA